jgi:hypothetical protein
MRNSDHRLVAVQAIAIPTLCFEIELGQLHRPAMAKQPTQNGHCAAPAAIKAKNSIRKINTQQPQSSGGGIRFRIFTGVQSRKIVYLTAKEGGRMAPFTSAVYDPPEDGLPTLAVVFLPGEDAILCRPVKDRPEGEALLERLYDELRAGFDGPGHA